MNYALISLVVGAAVLITLSFLYAYLQDKWNKEVNLPIAEAWAKYFEQLAKEDTQGVPSKLRITHRADNYERDTEEQKDERH